jgi:hypothetical protein
MEVLVQRYMDDGYGNTHLLKKGLLMKLFTTIFRKQNLILKFMMHY